MKCANAYGNPIRAASSAPYSDEPSTHNSGTVDPLGMARRGANALRAGDVPARYASVSAICSGKSSASRLSSAADTRPDPPGARPTPRSMRPGASASSMRKFSATLNAL